MSLAPARRSRLSRQAPNALFEAASPSDPFSILIAEHALLRQRLVRAEAAVSDQSDDSAVRHALGALSESLGIHQRREDVALYPLCESLFGGKRGAAAVLRDDHEAIGRQVGALLRESEDRGRVSSPHLDRLREAVDAHFGKEERILFPLTAALLSGTESSALTRRLRDASFPEAADRL